MVFFFKQNTAYEMRISGWSSDVCSSDLENRADICASVQHRIVTILLNKLKRAALETGIGQVAIAGGVSANSGLRKAMEAARLEHKWDVFLPKMEYCTDNADMIAIAGYYKYLTGDFTDQDVRPLARYAI